MSYRSSASRTPSGCIRLRRRNNPTSIRMNQGNCRMQARLNKLREVEPGEREGEKGGATTGMLGEEVAAAKEGVALCLLHLHPLPLHLRHLPPLCPPLCLLPRGEVAEVKGVTGAEAKG